MQLSQSLLYFSLMVSLTFVVLSGQETHQQPPVSSPEDTEQCVACDVRQHIKTMRLNAIKSQILSKLRMKEAPNISRDTVKQLLPKAPPLQQLLDQYDVLGDDNRDVVTEEDDELAITETVMMMATERKCLASCGLRVRNSAQKSPSKTVYARGRGAERGRHIEYCFIRLSLSHLKSCNLTTISDGKSSVVICGRNAKRNGGTTARFCQY